MGGNGYFGDFWRCYTGFRLTYWHTGSSLLELFPRETDVMVLTAHVLGEGMSGAGAF